MHGDALPLQASPVAGATKRHDSRDAWRGCIHDHVTCPLDDICYQRAGVEHSVCGKIDSAQDELNDESKGVDLPAVLQPITTGVSLTCAVWPPVMHAGKDKLLSSIVLACTLFHL